MEQKYENYKLHTYYIIGILIGVIALLLILWLYKIPDAADLLSFGATLASLALAVVAIAYVFLSSASLPQTINTLNRLSQDVDKMARELTQTTSEFRNELRTSPIEVISMDTGLNQVALEAKAVALTEKQQGQVAEVAEILIDNLSSAGYLVVHLFSLLYPKGVGGDIQEISSRTNGLIDELFVAGVLQVLSPLGLIEFKWNSNILSITKIHPKLRERARDELIKSLDKRPFKNSMLKNLAQLEEYIESL